MMKTIREWIKKHKNFNLIAGAVITGVILLIAVIGVFYTPYETTAMNAALKNTAPTLKHIMGCDNYGRDIFSRVMEGIRNTFFISLASVRLPGS